MPDFPEILSRSRFYLELKLDNSTDSVDGVFMECSGFQHTQAVVEVCEVTPQLWGKQGNTKGRVVRTKLPGNMTYSNLTLRRALTTSMTFWKWLQAVQDGNWWEQRRAGSVVIYNLSAEPQLRLEFEGAWPVSYKISDLDVGSGEFNVEEVEIAVELLKRVEPTT